MSRISETFAGLEGRKALIPFLMAGDPDLGASAGLLRAAAQVGDLVEIGVPFSDPIADGPTIQRAGQRALTAGTSLADVLRLVRELRGTVARPIVLLSYLNPILQYGPDRFCTDSRAAGVDGIIIPDLPADEGDVLIGPAHRADLDTIFLVAPTTSQTRLRLAAERSRGFVYCVSLTGVTGARVEVPPELEEVARRVKETTDLPVCVGFGISTPAQARAVGRVADGVIVGSALIDLVEREGVRAGPAIASLLESMRATLQSKP